MADASQTFNPALISVIVPALQQRGFVFDGSRTFRRAVGDAGILQLVNFQLGVRWLAGRFVVNLGVHVPGELSIGEQPASPAKTRCYHCSQSRSERLGRLLPGRLPSLQGAPFLGFLFGPRDIWWRHSWDKDVTEASLTKVLSLLDLHGIPWLERATPRG
jgi:hypothetical protein